MDVTLTFPSINGIVFSDAVFLRWAVKLSISEGSWRLIVGRDLSLHVTLLAETKSDNLTWDADVC
jgi:hypothetical protein